MRTELFDFDLPRELIATHPVKPRDAARLLQVRAAGLSDHRVRDLPDLLQPSDCLVFNDTRVIPAQLRGRRGEASLAVTLHRDEGGGRWGAFVRPAKKLRVGDGVDFGPGFSARVEEKRPAGEVVLFFDLAPVDFRSKLETYGAVPLPPYIVRKEGPRAADREDYQTIYAAHDGAVAAPTAGLHFTPELMHALAERGIESVFVTLHVGAGTFLPVKAEDTSEHRMHGEWGQIDACAAERLDAARAAGRRLVAVGTTSLRLLEAAADEKGRISPFEGVIDLFITPGYRFRAVDRLLTNFHLPRSTLFMLVAAFSGLVRMKRAYAHAIERGYRFYSYGDCTLLDRLEEAP